jgi:uncharacterized membrane protein HdeD (DUF308 family)
MQRTTSSKDSVMGVGPIAQDILTRIGKHWGWLLFYGIVTLAAGILTIFWPGSSLLAIAIVVGIQLLFTGVYRLIIAFSDLGQGHRGWLAFVGILSIAVGMLCLRNPFQTIPALTLLVGIFWTVSGVMYVIDAFADPALPNRGWAVFSGILSVIAGIVIFARPIDSAFALALLLGIWLTVLGVVEIVGAFRIKQLAAGPVRV